MPLTRIKVLTVSALKKKLTALRRNKTIAFTNGCFDILHWGHVSYLEAAKGKRRDRVLVVGLNSDWSVRSLNKGPGRPIVPEGERARILAALECVDFVVLFNETTPYELIKALRPDILIKGADWKGKRVAGDDIVRKVEFIRYVDGVSTTNIIEKIKTLCAVK